MSRKAGFRAAALLAAVTVVLALASAGALAVGGPSPSLLSPNHKHVAAGHIRLVVSVPRTPATHGVFITISPKPKLDRLGHLKFCAGRACDFVQPGHWKGHKYSYVAPFTFSGYWAVTPGKYYWQAHYYTVGDTAVYYSAVGWFVVK
jgi:hypothetical protein